MKVYSSLYDLFLEKQGTYFRLWEYKRAFTPYEQQNAFSDESLFVDVKAEDVLIEECIELPDGDYMIGCSPRYFAEKGVGAVVYYKLSQIHLEWWPEDTEKIKKPRRKNDVS